MTALNDNAEDATLGPLFADHLASLDAHAAAALEATGHAALCVFAGDETAPPRQDTPYPFRVEPFFNWWVPVPDAVGSAVCIEPGRRPKLIYLQPDDYWHAPPADPAGFYTASLDIEIVSSRAAMREAVSRLPARSAALGAAGSLADRFASVNDRDLLRRLEYARAVKTPYEVACLERASRRAARGHAAVAAAFGEGASEFELFLEYCRATEQRGTEMPYAPIIALDRHAAVLHYQHLERRRSGDSRLLLIDAGATELGYGADITRTTLREDVREDVRDRFREEGSAASGMAALRDGMDALQRQLCSELRAGVDFVELNDRAHVLLAGVLATHGLLRRGVSADEALAGGVTRVFLPHGLGHLLGLEVHDAGGRLMSPQGDERPPPPEHPYLRLTRRVEAGFVVTIEPGLYFIPSLLRTMAPAARALIDLAAVERLLPFGGIRIEDDVLVERDGVRNLTREAMAAMDHAAPR